MSNVYPDWIPHISLSQRVYELRKLHDLTQDELSRKVGIKRQHVAMIETGRSNVTLETLYKLARAFGITASELLSNVDILDE